MSAPPFEVEVRLVGIGGGGGALSKFGSGGGGGGPGAEEADCLWLCPDCTSWSASAGSIPSLFQVTPEG